MTAIAEGTVRPASTEHVSRAAGESRPIGYLIGAICIAVCTIMLAPLVLSFFASIKSPAEAKASPPSYLPHSFSLDSYLKVFEYQAGLWTYLSNSLLVAAFTILICLAPPGFWQ